MKIYLRLVVAERGKCGGWPLTCHPWWSPKEERWRRQWTQSSRIYIPRKPLERLVLAHLVSLNDVFELTGLFLLNIRWQKDSRSGQTVILEKKPNNQECFIENHSLKNNGTLNDQMNNQVSLIPRPMVPGPGSSPHSGTSPRSCPSGKGSAGQICAWGLKEEELLKWSFTHPWSQSQKNNGFHNQDKMSANISRE